MWNNIDIEIITGPDLCPFCGSEIDISRMSKEDYDEWRISKLCIKCQDDMFKWEDK